LIIGAFHAPYFYVTKQQKNRTHAGDEVSETAKAVTDGENPGGERPGAKPQAVSKR
jgi:hypothetical protein